MDQAQFIGFPRLEETLTTAIVVLTSAGVPINADALPTYHVYRGGTRLLSGTTSFQHNGTVTGCTNNTINPIVITSAAHGLAVGQLVTIANVGGNGAANGTWPVSAVTTDTFTIAAAGAGTGNYTSGGTWNTTGRYKAALALTQANGFTTGGPYEVDCNYQLSGVNNAQNQKFWID